MKNYTIKPYSPINLEIWNNFVNKAKNATFLFNRHFMEYHNDRFNDFSLLVFNEEKLVALLPANVSGNEVFSHQGLTYGGLIYDDKLKLANIIEITKAVLSFLNDNAIEKLHIKTIPFIYHKKPSQEIEYALFLTNARLEKRDTLSVIDLSRGYDFSTIRKRGMKKGIANSLVIKEENDFASFWNKILIPNLDKKHDAKPVHSVQEMEQLKLKFPLNIRQFNVYHHDEIVAGTTIFETEMVAHAQYISANENRDELGSLDYLYNHLIKTVFKDKKYFDFGISNEEQGRKLNNGLSYWKESFGASTIVHDFYEVETINYKLLSFN